MTNIISHINSFQVIGQKKKTQGFQLHDRILIKKLKIYKQGTHRRSDPIFRFQSNPNPQSCCKTKKKEKNY